MTAIQNQLVLDHINFAERVAASQFRKINFRVQFDEIKSAAYMGLVDAATKFNGTGNFTSYAFYRIVGEIKDYLRSLSWGGRKSELQVATGDCEVEMAEEAEPENFDDFFDDLVGNKLQPLAKQVLRMYYGQDLKIKEIAGRVELSSARVCQLLKSSLNTLEACA